MKAKRPQLLRIVEQAPPERADARENRERILKAARTMMKSRSIADICMDSLAEKAGVGKGTLYRRFKDRHSLCLALLDDAEQALQARVLAGMSLGEFVVAVAEHILDHAELFLEAAAFTPRGQDRYSHPVRLAYRYEIERQLKQPRPFIVDAILALLEPDFVVRQSQSMPRARFLLELERAALSLAKA